MCSDAGDRSRAWKDSHGQLFEKCLTLPFPGAAKHAAHLLRPHRAQLHLDVGHQISFMRMRGRLLPHFSHQLAGIQCHDLWLFLFFRQQRNQVGFSRIQRRRYGAERKVIRLGVNIHGFAVRQPEPYQRFGVTG